ncbi:MAG: FHA domain-containing serine/threonine-protein kinase [Planctomycetota bacterium]
MAKIILKVEGQPDREYPITGILKIGRRSTNDIVVIDNLSSRDHAEIFESGGACKVKDLGSHNGTLLNGVKINETVLKSGDVITIGTHRLYYEKAPLDEMLGERIAGYKILQRLGEGGMGKVYKARQISMDRVVALKVLSEKVTRDAAYVKAFIHEARVAGQLNHTHVVNVHDFGKTDEDIYYLSMEFVDGENVQAILERKGRLTAAESVVIVTQVAGALKYAHKNSIIHSDIKPQNILLDRAGSVKVADLGLAKIYGKGTFDSDPDVVMGTPYYMSPEQATKGKVDHRTDIYSLGATMYHMLTGRVPFEGDTVLSILTKQVTEPVVSPRKYDVTISESLAKVVMWMMAKNPADRPADMGAVEEALEQLKGVEEQRSAAQSARKGAAADVKQGMARRRKRADRRQAVGQFLPVVVIAVLAATGGFWYLKHKPVPQAPVIPVVAAVTAPAPPPRPAPVAPAPRPAAPRETGVELNFTGPGDQTALKSGGGWEGWSLDTARGYLESPAGARTTLEVRDRVYRVGACAGEISVEFLDGGGALSFYLEGNGPGRLCGVHVNPTELILFAGENTQTIPRAREQGAVVALVFDTRDGVNLTIGMGGLKAGMIPLGLTGFSGTAVIKLDDIHVRIHHIRMNVP